MSDAFNITGAGQDLCSLLRARTQSILLAAATVAGDAVETSRNDAFTEADAAAIAIYTPKISRTWLGDTPLAFTAKVNLAVVGRVLQPTLAQAECQIDTLRVQIENALLTNPQFYAAPLERINSIDTTIEFPEANSPHEAQMTMVFECQCEDLFFAAVPQNSLITIGLTSPSPLNAENTLIGATITLSS